MKVFKVSLAVLGLLLAFFVVGPAPAQAAPYCGITWGSLAKTAGTGSSATIVNVRAGQHACYDRVVVDISGHATGYRVSYVASVASEGSGQAVPLRGGAFLKITALAPAYSASGASTYVPANRMELIKTNGFQTFRQLALAGSFEGQTTLGLGVRARLPFQVFLLNGPGNSTRMVIDVAHRW